MGVRHFRLLSASTLETVRARAASAVTAWAAQWGLGLDACEVRCAVVHRPRDPGGAVAVQLLRRHVADKMFISERTVKAHLGAIFEKLGVRDRLQLVLRLAASPEPASTTAAEPKS